MDEGADVMGWFGRLPKSGVRPIASSLDEAAVTKSALIDMSEPARMQRAREQGFDVDTPLYHGTSGDFDAFRASRSGVFGPGVYVSEDPSVASSYAQRAGAKGGSPNVMPLFVRGRVANDAEYQAAFRQATAEGKQGSNRPLRIAQILKQKGFSGARIPGDGDLVPSQIVVFDPNDIRGKFAAFDPSQSGSSKLLAGVPAAIGGGLLSRWALMQDGDQYA